MSQRSAARASGNAAALIAVDVDGFSLEKSTNLGRTWKRLHSDETWAHALQRELQETGYHTSRIGPHVWERTTAISPDGSLTQRERYYLIRVQRFEPLSHALEQDERGWSVDSAGGISQTCPAVRQ